MTCPGRAPAVNSYAPGWHGIGGEDGVSLVEVVVTLALTSVLGVIVVLAVQNNHQLHRATADESSGLADVKTVVERLGRDIRSARSVDANATRSRLVLWVDSNSDSAKSADEIITWEVVPGPSDQYNVLRTTQGGQPAVQARTLVDSLSFCYWAQPPSATTPSCTGSLPVPLSVESAADTRLVTTTLTYDAQVSSGTQARSQTFSSTLRNVN